MEAIFLQIGTSIINAVNSKVERMIDLAPYVLGALGVFLFGWILAELAARAILNLGHKIKLEWLAEKIGLTHFLEKTKLKQSPSEVIASGMKGYLIFLFFIEATKIAKLTEVADFLGVIYGYIPQIIVALFIMMVGIRISHTLQVVITTSLSFAKASTADVLGLAAKYTVITFSVLAALSQLDIAQILINILFVGFISMLTIAGGLAFGLGGKDMVADLLQDVKKVELKEIKKEIKEDLIEREKRKHRK